MVIMYLSHERVLSPLTHFLAHLVERWTQKVLQSAIASSSRSYRQLI